MIVDMQARRHMVDYLDCELPWSMYEHPRKVEHHLDRCLEDSNGRYTLTEILEDIIWRALD